MTPQIVPAAAADFDAITALLRDAGLPGDGLREHLGDAIIARDDAGLVACAALEVYGDDALLRSVAVRQDHRGTGVGRAIVEAAMMHADRRGVRHLYLFTLSAQRFFEQLGFVVSSRDALPAALHESIEWRIHCCESATVMRK